MRIEQGKRLTRLDWTVARAKFDRQEPIDYAWRCISIGSDEPSQLLGIQEELIARVKKHFPATTAAKFQVLFQRFIDNFGDDEFEHFVLRVFEWELQNQNLLYESFNNWQAVLLSDTYDTYIDMYNS